MASGGKVKLHRTVLRRCLPSLVRDLDFKAVSIYIYQMELFDDITFRDISEQRVSSDRIRELIHRLQQRDENTYDKFKKCLVLSKQEYLKDILEIEETKVYMEVNKNQEETLEKKNVFMVVEEKHEIQHTGTAREIKTEDSFTMEVDTDAPVTVDNVVIKFDDETSHERGKHPNVYDRAAMWMKLLSKDLPGPTQAAVGPPAIKTEYIQHSRQQQLSNNHEQFLQEEEPKHFQCDTQHEKSKEKYGLTQQTANYWGIYEKAQAWYDLVFCRKSREYKPTMKAIKQEMSQNPVMKLRDITETKEPLRQSVTFDESDGPVDVGHTSTQMGGYFTTMKDNSSGSGPVVCSSIMHNLKSYNDIHEGKGKEGIGEPSSTPALSSISFMDGKIVLKEHYDVCIIFSDEDEDDVYTFIEHLKRIDLGGKEYPKICRFDDEGIWGLATRVNRVPLICNHCSVIFVFVSKTGLSDSYTKFFQDEVVMSSLKNCKVRPVLSEENCSIPAGMQNIPPIKWYRRDTRAYQENIKSILDYSRKARLHRENNRIQTILPDF